MSVTATVSIDRSSLSKSALVIGTDVTGTYVLTQGGLGRPVVTPRYVYAPTSRYLDGAELLAASRDQSALVLEVLVQASTSAALDTAVADLDEALWQFSYDVTEQIADRGANVWHCLATMSNPASGVTDPAHVEQFFEVLAITIPCKPIPA